MAITSQPRVTTGYRRESLLSRWSWSKIRQVRRHQERCRDCTPAARCAYRPLPRLVRASRARLSRPADSEIV
jgi:hypothetical protein